MVQICFSRVCSTDSSSFREQKNWKKTRLKQCTKEGTSKRCYRRQSTWLIITLLSNRYCSAVAPILLRSPSVVALLSYRYRTGIAPLLLRCYCSFCRYAVAPQSHRKRATVAPLLSLLLSLRSRTAIAPLLNRCCSGLERV